MKKAHINREALYASVQLPAIGYVRLPTVCAITGLGRSTVWAWVRKGRFPAPVKLSARVSAWSVDDVREWMVDPQAWQAAKSEG